MGSVECERCSESVCRKLIELGVVAQAEVLAAYAPTDGEIDISRLIREWQASDRCILLPRFDPAAGQYRMVPVHGFETDTVIGAYGIREPGPDVPAVSWNRLACESVTWIVPGIAFDLAGNRLGRGAGYYDRLLDGTRGPKIGVGYDWQLVSAVPTEGHDVKMDAIVTDRRLCRF